MSIFKSHIQAMSAYAPPLDGRDPDTHDLLDFNERTRPVSEGVQNALIDYIRSGRLQMYPAYANVVDRIASYAGVSADHLMITNGSDQGIDLVFRSACQAGDEVIIPGPSFAMYSQCAGIENVKVVAPFYTKDGGYPKDEVLAAITPKTRVIVVSNPNNPCGTLTSRDTIKEIALAAPHAAILVDECYFEYTKLSVVDWICELPNLVVTRTFSKTWGLPSLRLGYVISAKENVDALLNVRGPYDINQLAIVAIEAALSDISSVHTYIDQVMNISKPMFETFLRENNVEFWSSDANFVWTFFNEPLAVEKALRESGILVRPKQDKDGLMGLRITLGTQEQTETLIENIRRICF